MRVLDDQVAIVTGGGHGIGRAISHEIAMAGAHVVVAGRHGEHLDETVRLIRLEGGVADGVAADVTQQEQVQGLMDRAVSEYGKIDVLINNAGRFRSIGPIWEVDPGDWWEDVTVNLYGVFLCCRAAIKHMITRRAGKVINLGGGGSLRPLPFGSGYGSSKAAVARFGETLQEEVRRLGIMVFTVSPGFVRSGITQYQAESLEGQTWLPHVARRLSDGNHVDPKHVGRLCVFLASPEGDALSGRYIEATEDYRRIAACLDEVAAKDLYTLRRGTLSSQRGLSSA